MRYAILFMCLSCTLLGALTVGDWQNIRFSGRNSAQEVLLRTEIDLTSVTTSEVLYPTAGGIAATPLPYWSGTTCQATIPSVTAAKPIGLRIRDGGNPQVVVPVPYSGTTLPALSQMTLISNEGTGETSYTNLDIVQDYFTWSDTRFYAGIRNRSGTFPSSANFGTTQYIYLAAIGSRNVNINDPNAVAWAMIYVNASILGFTPGLYKITGTSLSDLTRVANIEYTVDSSNQLLKMSCSRADLMADADFTAFFNADDPEIGMLTATLFVQVLQGSVNQGDNTDGGVLRLRSIILDPGSDNIPVIGAPEYVVEGDDSYFRSLYYDAEGNFPIATVVQSQDGLYSYDLLPQGYDFINPSYLRTVNLTGVLNEFDTSFRSLTTDDGENLGVGAWTPFCQIGALPKPVNPLITLSGADVLTLQWEPVTQSQLGTPLTTVSYRVESSDSAGFETFDVLGSTSETSYTVNGADTRRFYRVIAIR